MSVGTDSTAELSAGTGQNDARAEAAAARPLDDVGLHALTKAVWALSLPILFAVVGENVIFITDTAFLGRVGSTELAAIALADTILELLAVPALGLVEAMQIVIARRVGERRDAAAGQTFNRALLVVLLVTGVLAVGLLLGSGPIARTVGDSQRVARALGDFLRIAAFGLVLMAVNFAFTGLFVALGRARILIGATLALTLTNLALSWILVLGELGAPRLGMRGAAYAFLGAEGVALLYNLAVTVRRISISRYGLLRPRRWGAALIGPLLRMGSPLALQLALEAARWFAFFVVLAQVSDHALAIASVVFACYGVLTIPAIAFDESAYSLVSRLIGRGRPERIRQLMSRVVVLAYLVSAPLLLIAVLFPDTVLSLFSSDRPTVLGAHAPLQVAALALIIVVPAQLWLGALNGTGDADAAFVIELLSSAVMLGATAVAALALHLDLQYVWLSVPAAALVSLAFSYARVRGGGWRRRAI